jgi:hypothetical protein
MKKYFVMVLAVMTAIVATSCTGKTGPVGPAGTNANDQFTPPANAQILVNENFESYAIGVTPTGWTRANVWTDSSVYAPVTNTTFVSYGKCLMIDGFNLGGISVDRQIVKCPGIENAISNTLTGKVYIQFYAQKSTSTKAKGFVFYLNQFEKMRIDFGINGVISAYTGLNTSAPIASYTAGAWTKVNVIINLNTQTYDVYTDSILRTTGIPCYNSFEQLNNTSIVATIDRVYKDFFGVLTNQTANYIGDAVYVDDVLIYYVP